MPIPLLRVTAEPLEDAILVRAAGEIDMSTVDVLRRELDAVREEAAAALLDLPGVTFIDSSGLHLLLDASHDSAVSDWDSSSSGPLRWWSVCSKSVVRPNWIMVVDPRADRVLR